MWKVIFFDPREGLRPSHEPTPVPEARRRSKLRLPGEYPLASLALALSPKEGLARS
jgi:hypothetical protein